MEPLWGYTKGVLDSRIRGFLFLDPPRGFDRVKPLKPREGEP